MGKVIQPLVDFFQRENMQVGKKNGVGAPSGVCTYVYFSLY